MAKDKSKTNVQARAQEKALAAQCKICGNRTEIAVRVPPSGRRYTVRLCCERAGIAA